MLRLLAFAIVVTLVACPPAQAQARIDVWTLADDAAALSAEGRLREAIALLEEAVRAVPQNGALRLRLAELYLRADDRAAATPHLDAAIRDVTAYLATNPRSPEGSRNTLARAHALRGDAAQAEPLFRQNVAALEAEAQKQGTALTRDAKRTLAGTHTMLADAYAGLGDAAKARALRLDAVRLLEEAAAADPAAPYVHAQLAEVHEALGDAARARASQLAAIEAYKRVIDGPIAQSEREFQYIMLGRAYATMGDFTRARESYQTAGQRRPDGTPSAREAHARDVIVELEQRIARRQASSATPAEEHFRQAFDLLQAGKVDDATVEFQTGLRKKPGEPRAHFYVAEAYRRRGDVRPAIEHYRAALAGGVPDPLAAQARTEVASLYVEQVVQATRQRTGSFGALDRARTLARAALFHARIGAPARAQALFADALRMAEIDSESNCFTTFPCRTQARVDIALRQAAAGDVRGATATANLIALPMARAYALARIAEALHRTGATAQARPLIGQAFAQVGADRSTVERVHGLRSITEALARMGDADGARKSLEAMRVAVEANTEAGRTANERHENALEAFMSGLEALDRRGYAYSTLAVTLLSLGDRAGAAQAMSRVQRSETRAFLARELAENGFPDEADQVTQGLAFSLPYDQRTTLHAVAVAHARKGSFERAWSAAARVTTADGPEHREHALFEVAKIQAHAGRTDDAVKALSARTTCNEFCRGRLGRDHALGLARRGDVEAALKASPDLGGPDYNLALAYATLGLRED